MNRDPILFRVDGTTATGLERLARCLTLAAALQRRRRPTYFLSQLEPASLALAIKRAGKCPRMPASSFMTATGAANGSSLCQGTVACSAPMARCLVHRCRSAVRIVSALSATFKPAFSRGLCGCRTSGIVLVGLVEVGKIQLVTVRVVEVGELNALVFHNRASESHPSFLQHRDRFVIRLRKL